MMERTQAFGNPTKLRHFLMRNRVVKGWSYLLWLLLFIMMVDVFVAAAPPEMHFLMRYATLIGLGIAIAIPLGRAVVDTRQLRTLHKVVDETARAIRENGVIWADSGLVATKGRLLSSDRFYRGVYCTSDTAKTVVFDYDSGEQNGDVFRLTCISIEDTVKDFGTWNVKDLDQVVAICEAALPDATFIVSTGITHSTSFHKAEMKKSSLLHMPIGTHDVVWTPSRIGSHLTKPVAH